MRDHPRHGEYIILNQEQIELDPREALILAKIVRYHHKNLPSMMDFDGGKLNLPTDRDLVRVLIMFLRTAEILNRAVADVFYSCKNGGDVCLNMVSTEHAVLTPKLKILASEAAEFEMIFDRKFIVRVRPGIDVFF
jgi:exopolyphosphatase/pppGpp-phosphohydrolase